MGKAIVVLSLVVLCSFAFVLLQLSLRRGAAQSRPDRPGPLVEVRDDGSVYAVRIRLDQIEERLISEEMRSSRLGSQVAELTKERDALRGEVNSLHEELQRVRRELAQREPEPSQTPPASGPSTSSEPPPAGDGAAP